MSKSKSFSLIVPIAADKPEFETSLPQLFAPSTDGIMICVKSILGLNVDVFDNIYFTILQKHAELYDIDKLLQLQFKRLNLKKAKLTILENPTKSQVETICQTVKKESIEGAVYIKDADCCFKAMAEPANSIAIYPLEDLNWVNPQHKSYVSVDEMHYVTNIIERRIVSHYFCAGGYGFENASELCKYYNRLKSNQGLYLSHIIYAMLLDNKTFRPLYISEYKDFEENEK